MKKWGLLKEGREITEPEELEEDQAIFAPNHYCVHHGGLQHEGKIKMAEAVNHNFNRKLNRVTHYDMKLEDGTILEAVAAEDIQVVNASLAEVEDHTHSHDIYGGGDDEGGCPSEEGGEAIDISAPGTEVHVDDISELSPEEAFAAGMAAAKEAIESAMGGGGPPEGGGPLEEDELEESTYYRKDERGKKREESISRKISVREAKELTHRVIERIKMENK